MEPYISLCMIVKNEEKVLERCLDSVKNIVDEMIIVDTGSTDKTKEIALKYVDTVYNFVWTNSFADARNFAQSKAKGKWILVMDADEYVDNENLKFAIEELKEQSKQPDAFEVKIYNFTGLNAEKIVQHKSLRIYRNDPSIYYYRTIHEQLIKKEGELVTNSSKLILFHSGYLTSTVQEKNKNMRNKSLIEREINQSGHTPFDYFNLGNEYLSIGEVEKALDSYLNAYQKKLDFRYSWVSFCIVQIIACLTRLERYQDALLVINDAEKIYDQSPDFICLKANIYILQHRYEDATEELELLLKNKENYNYPITSIDFLEFHPHQLLGKIHEIKNNYPKAVYHNTKALNINNKSIDVLYNLISILIKSCSFMEIYNFFEERKWIKNQQDNIRIIRIFTNLNQVDLAKMYLKNLEDQNIKKGFEVKISFLNGNLDFISQYIHKETVENLLYILKNGCIDLYDFLIYGLVKKDRNFLLLLSTLVSEENDKEFIQFLIEDTTTFQINKNSYLTLLERCIQTRQFELFERLLEHRQIFEESICVSIGNLLFRYDFTELAFDFYSSCNTEYFDEQSYFNVINGFLKQNYGEDALQFALNALEENHIDFRIFKIAIQILNDHGKDEDKEQLLNLALHYYPDSNWLKDVAVFGL